MHWEIHLDGEDEHLNLLSTVGTNEQLSISKRDGVYILRSHKVDQLQDAKEVSKLSREIVGRFSYIRLLRGYTSIKIKSIFQILDDGRKLLILEPDPIVGKISAYVSSIHVTRADGRVEKWDESIPLKKCFQLAEKDEKVSKALRLRDSDNLNWVDLYRIYEVIKEDVRKKGGIENLMIKKEGEKTRDIEDLNRQRITKEIVRFRHTANSVAASGDNSRHGVDISTTPPTNPMSLPEAQDLIDTIIISWINSKQI